MAKRETSARRQVKGRRETNSQRRERERKRSAILRIAKWIEWRINRRKTLAQFTNSVVCTMNSRRKLVQRKQIESAQHKRLESALGKHIDAVMTIRDTWIKSQSTENIVKGLRLAADMLEGKPNDARTFGAHNDQVRGAWYDACHEVARWHPSRARPLYEDVPLDSSRQVFWALPTFSEFLLVYRGQNPGTKVEGRTLRRTLERLDLRTAPSKRGRPKKIGTRNRRDAVFF